MYQGYFAVQSSAGLLRDEIREPDIRPGLQLLVRFFFLGGGGARRPAARALTRRSDLRAPCPVPGCYDDTPTKNYLNTPAVRLELGVPVSHPPWTPCSGRVYGAITVRDDLESFTQALLTLLQTGIPVLVYAGDCDFICNWMGNLAWMLNLDWPGKAGFNAAVQASWRGLGTARTHNNLTFVRVFEAGHLVPYNQPAAALALFEDFVKGVWTA